MKIKLLIILFAIIKTANGQVPAWKWAESAGGSGEDVSQSITSDINGNIYATGYFKSATFILGNDTLTNAANTDFFIVKYDTSGNVIWAKDASGSTLAYGYSVASDNNGNAYVAGLFSGASITFGTYTLTNTTPSTYEIFIVKYDSNGNVIWAKNAGGSSDDYGYGIHADQNSNIYVTGYFRSSTIIFGSDTLINTGTANLFIVKYDSSGNALWANKASSSYNEGKDIAVDDSGNVFVTGIFFNTSISFGSITLLNTGNNDVFVVKYNAAGNVIWAKSGGGSGNDYGYSIAADKNGNAFVTGFFKSPNITFNSSSLINNAVDEMFIVKYDSSGNVIWAKKSGASGFNARIYGRSVSTDTLGNVLLSGDFACIGLIFGNCVLYTTGSLDIYIVKYDAAGNVLWAKGTTSSFNDDKCFGITTGINDNVYVTGGTKSYNIIFENDTITNVNTSVDDIFVARLGNLCLAINTTINNVTCMGGNDGSAIQFVSGGFPPYIYQWNTGQTTSGISGVTAGNYTVTINDSIGCTVINFITINQAPALTSTMNVTNASSCSANDGSATAIVSGGTAPYSYLWNPTGQTTQTAFNLAVDTFVVSIIDANGCTITDTAIVSCVTGITENNLKNNITISPNPSSGVFQIQVGNGQLAVGNEYKIEIMNVLGEKVFAWDKGQGTGGVGNSQSTQLTINLSGEPSGIYFVKVETAEGVATQKIILQR